MLPRYILHWRFHPLLHLPLLIYHEALRHGVLLTSCLDHSACCCCCCCRRPFFRLQPSYTGKGVSPNIDIMAQTGVAGVLLGPLTTTWTMPQSCSIFMPGCSTCDNAYNGQSCNPTSGGQVMDNTACWPPASSGVASPTWPFVGWGFYSPGLACPAGYTSACTAVYGQRPPWSTQFSLVPSETAIGCCPT